MCIISFSPAPFVGVAHIVAIDAASMPAGDFILCLMTLRQSVWGKGISGNCPAVLYWEISETGRSGHSHLSSLHIIWIGDEKVRGVEKLRTYYLDETKV